MKRIFFLLVMLVLLIPGLARAQETVFLSKKGMTVWGVLQKQGCTPKQIVSLWPQVFADSGLRREDERHLKLGTVITLKLDCSGQPRENLAASLAEARGIIKRLEGKNKTLSDTLKIRDGELAELAKATAWDPGQTFVGMGLGILLAIAGYFLLVRRKKEAVVPEVNVLHTGMVHRHGREYFINYEGWCEFCNNRFLVTNDNDTNRHLDSHPTARMTERHRDESALTDEDHTHRMPRDTH